MKKIIISFFLFLSIFYPMQIRVEATEIQPYAIAVEGPIYGYCSSSGRITTVYVGRFTLNGGGNRVVEITTSEYFDTVNNPYVVFTYTDNTGYSSTPYLAQTFAADSLYIDVGDFGPCPFLD